MVKGFHGLRGWFVALKDNFKIDNRSCKPFNRETPLVLAFANKHHRPQNPHNTHCVYQMKLFPIDNSPENSDHRNDVGGGTGKKGRGVFD